MPASVRFAGADASTALQDTSETSWRTARRPVYVQPDANFYAVTNWRWFRSPRPEARQAPGGVVVAEGQDVGAQDAAGGAGMQVDLAADPAAIEATWVSGMTRRS